MGMFAFRRAKEQEAALTAVSCPAPISTPKKKRKPKAKVKALTNGNLDSCDSRISISE